MVMKVGLIGCGNISDIYLTNAPLFRDFAFAAVSDINAEAAQRQGRAYDLPAMTVEDLLAREDIDIVLNLTIPEAHAPVALQALASGKHVFGEKPLATTLADGRRLRDAAAAAELRIGSAPDTFLGAAVQLAGAMIDSGAIGRPLSGLAAVMGHGMEAWHPDPTFFYKPGGGPVLDMGPYYIAALVALLGPVARVNAVGQIGFAERVVTTPGSRILGQAIKVEVLTSVQAFLTFASGAQITFLASWDVWRHGVRPIELHGTEASLRIPDPNFFGGDVELATGAGEWVAHKTAEHVFGVPNWPRDQRNRANYRGLGLADMARGISDGRPHRASGDLALHTLAVMSAILTSAMQDGNGVAVEESCARPAPFGEVEAAGLLEGVARSTAAAPAISA